MKSRKIISLLAIVILLVSTVLVLLPSVSAAELRTVRGYVYVDGVITTPMQITLIIADQQKTATIPGTPVGYYAIDFNVANGKTGVFHVNLAGGTWQAQETLTIKAGVTVYLNFNLTVNTSLPPINNPPNTPSTPSGPSTGNPAVSYTFSTSATDPDGDQVYYKFDWDDGTFSDWLGPYSSGALRSASHSWPLGTYYVKAKAKDVYGSESGWSSPKTVTISPSPPGPGPGPGPSPPTAPIANAGGPYFGFPNEDIEFDASGSYAQDGKVIVGYRWDFDNDGTYDTDWLTTNRVTHSYPQVGTYTVKLEVKDNDGIPSTDTTTATIRTANLPPTPPVINGNTTGNKNIEYTYTAVSTDPDGDNISYTFDWGDGTNTTTDFLPNGTAVSLNNSWAKAGVYTLTVYASDNQTISYSELVVSIDAEVVDDIGYLTDDDGDGIYDTFYSTTGETTAVEMTAEGTYLIDSDGDSDWDYIYDPQTKQLTKYIIDDEIPAPESSLWLLGGILGFIAVLFLVIAALIRKKKQTAEAQETKPAAKKSGKKK